MGGAASSERRPSEEDVEGAGSSPRTPHADPVSGTPNYGSFANFDISGNSSARRSGRRVTLAHEASSNKLLLDMSCLDRNPNGSSEPDQNSNEEKTYEDNVDDSFPKTDSNSSRKSVDDPTGEFDTPKLSQNNLGPDVELHGHKHVSVSPDIPTVEPHRFFKPGKILMKRSASSVFKAYDTTLDPFAKTYLTELPRGGHWCRLGDVVFQFGCPPETIKDSMTLGIPVPQYFIVLGQLFSRTRGLCVAELEFPAYFNFFIRRQRTVVVTTAAVEPRIRAVFQETLLGPKAKYLRLDQDFPSDRPSHYFPNFKNEGEWLDNARKTLTIDDLLEFKIFEGADFDSSGYAHTLVTSLKNGEVIIEFKRKEKVFEVHSPKHILEPGHFSLFGEEVVRSIEKDAFDQADHSPTELDPDSPEALGKTLEELPVFGVTMLGTSHGFDPKGRTTGFVLWANRRGTMVDPPPNAIECLNQLSISARPIDSVVLTHCHSDHDAGTFRRVLLDQHITIYTTQTIFDSFIRKYSAITGLSREFLQQLLHFRKVCIGEDVAIHGATWNFFYSLHTIPCIGFSVTVDKTVIAYSADTHNDPDLFQRMYDDKVIGEGRMEGLASFPWDADLILHEAGVPPIHTPMQRLVNLSDEIKAKTYVVHVAQKDIPKGSGLQSLSNGTTVSLPVNPAPMEAAIEIIDVLASNDLFQTTCQTFRDAISILHAFHYECFEPGEAIVHAGDPGDQCYIITRGIAVVSWFVDGQRQEKMFNVGDYFGETSLVTGEPRNADVHAITHVKVASLSKKAFNMLVHGTDVARDLITLSETRKTNSWQLISLNSVTRKFSSTAKTQLEYIMEERKFVAGEVAWEVGDPAGFILIVQTGLFHFKCDEVKLRDRNISLNIAVDEDSGHLKIMNAPIHRSASSAARDTSIPLTRSETLAEGSELSASPRSPRSPRSGELSFSNDQSLDYSETESKEAPGRMPSFMNSSDALDSKKRRKSSVLFSASSMSGKGETFTHHRGMIDIEANTTEDLCGEGIIIGDFDAVFADAPVASTCFCVEEGTALIITQAKWKQFCGRYPGGLLFFMNKHVAK